MNARDNHGRTPLQCVIENMRVDSPKVAIHDARCVLELYIQASRTRKSVQELVLGNESSYTYFRLLPQDLRAHIATTLVVQPCYELQAEACLNYLQNFQADLKQVCQDNKLIHHFQRTECLDKLVNVTGMIDLVQAYRNS